LGIVTEIYSAEEHDELVAALGPSEDADDNKIGKILRIANTDDKMYLPRKLERETFYLNACQQYVARTFLPMNVYGVEYQFDGNVLFVYYLSNDRVDFRPLVKFLIKAFCRGIRIQMKRTNLCREFIPVASASYSLSTGNFISLNNVSAHW